MLDDKLREIIRHDNDSFGFVCDVFATEEHDPPYICNCTLESKLTKVHQAFADEGYCKLPTGGFSIPKKMTGQEWYDRFIHELHWDSEHPVLAAQKASGLDV